MAKCYLHIWCNALKGSYREMHQQPAARSTETRILNRLALCQRAYCLEVKGFKYLEKQDKWQWAWKEKRQLGSLSPWLGAAFESWPRLTSNPPAVDSCDAPASWDVRTQSAAAPVPAAASGCSWNQHKTVQWFKAQPVKLWMLMKTEL